MDKIRRGSTNRETVIMLQELLKLAGYRLSVDGIFGRGTDTAVRDYQRKNRLIVDGIVGDKTWMRLFAQFPHYLEGRVKKHLSETDIRRVAADLGLEVAVVKAVNEVESRGHGFAGGKPVILFEGHIFWRRLKAHGIDPSRHKAGNEDVLYYRWTRDHYLGGVREHERLAKAKRIHEAAALESASWGLFQIMGFHWQSLGYSSVKAFVTRMKLHEREHLIAFASFLRVNDLVAPLASHDWATFARGYNGPGYKANRYDEKLARAYARHAAG